MIVRRISLELSWRNTTAKTFERQENTRELNENK